MDAHAVADLDVMLDHRMAADADVVTDCVLFADKCSVPTLETCADAVARIDDGMRADRRVFSDHCDQFARFLAPRRLTEDNEIADLEPFAQLDVWIQPVRWHHFPLAHATLIAIPPSSRER